MFSIQKSLVPANTLLDKYSIDGGYADCYSTEIPRQVSFSEFVYFFYTTDLFKLERLILRWTASKPSTDPQARQLADGIRTTFAAWHVENRNETELLMCDFQGQTRSWMMVVPVRSVQTRLYFGSAIVPNRNTKTGALSIGFVYQASLGFHRIYSILLLYFAKLRIMSQK